MFPWGKICRICASPADYEIFANIPIYLHASSKEYLDWQTPINEMIEETTGLKVSSDDGLPKNICALCISYLKHAKTFREQAINTCLNFLAVQTYKNIANDKEVWNYENAAIKAERNSYDVENLKNNQSKEQNKVSKILMSNTIINSSPHLSRQVQLSLKYLSQLYDENVSTETNSNNLEKRRNGAYKPITKQRRHYSKPADATKPSTSGCNSNRHNLEDDLPRTTSSDEYETPEEAGTSHNKNNIFSYKEKNFEEDDIMDLDELKEAITINIPSTCKEHKCSFCFKRFMFEESFEEHIKTCIEYKFATFLEEMNNLLYIRRAKEISPHEFIRRMIFSLRKTCEWLKNNCIDAALPDLLQNNHTTDTNLSKQRLESSSKSTGSSTEDNFTHKIEHKTLLPTTPLAATKPTVECNNTPINISNNILYEIERTESRNSQKMKLKKPIPILATSNIIKSVNNLNNEKEKSFSQEPERLAFIEKLQNAAKPMVAENVLTFSPNISTPKKSSLQSENNIVKTPLISVRQDLLAPNGLAENSSTYTSPLRELFQTSYLFNSPASVSNPCARCPQCNLYFETLNALEIHNALQHNSIAAVPRPTQNQTEDERALEHKRIIALFEDDDEI